MLLTISHTLTCVNPERNFHLSARQIPHCPFPYHSAHVQSVLGQLQWCEC